MTLHHYPGRDDRPDGLAVLGVRAGEAVRWRPLGGGRWQTGTARHRETDGSVGVIDGRGALRSLPVERLEVHCSGPRGGTRWEPLPARAGRSEQLSLLPGS